MSSSPVAKGLVGEEVEANSWRKSPSSPSSSSAQFFAPVVGSPLISVCSPLG